MFDLIIENGKIVDGTGNPWFNASVGITGAKIRCIGTINEKARRTINAEGLIVCPGFIDPHSHSDFVYLINPASSFKVQQGVTTEVIGNCGLSPAPVPKSKNYFDIFKGYIEQISGGFDKFNWTSLNGFVRRQRQTGSAVNLLILVGHGNLRIAAMGMDNRAPNSRELFEMRDQLEQSMKSGAAGLSTGLMYPPGFYSQLSENVELARIAARYGGIVTSHIRSYSDKLAVSVEELIEIGRQARLPVHLSHVTAALEQNWGKMTMISERVDRARKEGVDITMDRYPYTAANTSLRSVLPQWMQAGGVPKLLARLRDPESRKKAAAELEHFNWEKTYVYLCRENPDLNGKSVVEISKIWNKTIAATIFDLLSAEEARPMAILFIHSEDDMRLAFQHPSVMIGSDSGPGGAGSHPRTYGTFPRVLRQLVIEEKLINLEEAIRKMTSMPAYRFRLWDRGLIKPGMAADLVLFDLERVRDKSTYQNPCQPSEGIEFVIVNGKPAIDNGVPTQAVAGKVLR